MQYIVLVSYYTNPNKYTTHSCELLEQTPRRFGISWGKVDSKPRWQKQCLSLELPQEGYGGWGDLAMKNADLQSSQQNSVTHPMCSPRVPPLLTRILPPHWQLCHSLHMIWNPSACLLSPFSRVQLSVTLCTVACQAPLSMSSPGRSTRVDCQALLQGTFLTHGLNPCLLCLLYW